MILSRCESTSIEVSSTLLRAIIVCATLTLEVKRTDSDGEQAV